MERGRPCPHERAARRISRACYAPLCGKDARAPVRRSPLLTPTLLQIRQPPIASSRLDAGKPLAQRIKQEHAAYPAEVNDDQIEAVALRRVAKPVDRSLEQPAH